MSFRALYPSASKFKYIAQTLAKIADEIPFTVNENGLFVKTLSPDKTTMISLNIPSLAFDEFECPEETTFIVSSDEFNRTARRGSRNDMVELVLERENRRLRMAFIDKKLGYKRTFYVQLKEGIIEKLPEPKLKLPAIVRMVSDDFKNIIKDAKIVGDEIEFVATSDKLEARTITPQKEYYNIMKPDRPLISLMVEESEVRSTYGIDLLEITLKAIAASETVTLEFGSSMPMKVTFDVPGGGTLVYWVAPRAQA